LIIFGTIPFSSGNSVFGNFHHQQGDQIGRMVNHLGDRLYWPVFLITKEAQILGLIFSAVKVLCSFEQNMSWATFWALFLQIHLVALIHQPH
jgi:hypothetical protein